MIGNACYYRHGHNNSMKKLIDIYRNTNQYVNDAIDRIIVGIHLKKQKDGCKMIMLSGCEPGVGTTTISISLAISMANTGWRTILIDGDLRKMEKYKRLNKGAEIGLSEFLSNKALYHEIIYDTNHDNLFYISSGRGALNPVSLLCSDKMEELIGRLNEGYDYIVIDMPSVTTSIDANVLANKVDSIILVSAYAKTDKTSIRESKDALTNSGGNIMGIILNKMEASTYGTIIKNFDYYKDQKYVNRRTRAKANYSYKEDMQRRG